MPRAANAVVTFDGFWDSDAKPTATPIIRRFHTSTQTQVDSQEEVRNEV